MDDIFGDSLEKNSKKPSNRQRKRVSNSGDVPASLKDIAILKKMPFSGSILVGNFEQ